MPACMQAMPEACCGGDRHDTGMHGACLQDSSPASLCGLALPLGLGSLEGLGSAPALEAPVVHHLSYSHLPQRLSWLSVSPRDARKAWFFNQHLTDTDRAKTESLMPCMR